MLRLWHHGCVSAEDLPLTVWVAGYRIDWPYAKWARLMADIRGLREAVYWGLGADGRLVMDGLRGDARLPLKRIALDVVDTFDAAGAGRLTLKCCANHSSCGWLFADTSKNGKRRWCAMQTCGTLSKMATLRRRGAAGYAEATPHPNPLPLKGRGIAYGFLGLEVVRRRDSLSRQSTKGRLPFRALISISALYLTRALVTPHIGLAI